MPCIFQSTLNLPTRMSIAQHRCYGAETCLRQSPLYQALLLMPRNLDLAARARAESAQIIRRGQAHLVLAHAYPLTTSCSYGCGLKPHNW